MLLIPFALAAAAIGASCGTSQPAGGPSGSLSLSGALSGVVSVGPQRPAVDRLPCQPMQEPSLSNGRTMPAGTPITLEGEVDFDSGQSQVFLRFVGGLGASRMPLAGDTQPGSISLSSASGASWEAGQSSPTSSGTLTISQAADGTIHGSVDATLAPSRGSSTTLHVSGSWTC
jgi:hypothetical protein